MKPKFSVIIPAYGVAPWIAGCVESVLIAASRVEKGLVEIIAVDDGSPDESGKILDRYGDRITVVHQANAGVGAARNNGIEHAHGEWILFVDGDDQVMSEMFEYLNRVTCENDVDIVHFSCAEVDSPNEKIAYRECSCRVYDYAEGNEAAEAYRDFLNLLAWNASFKRSLIGDIRFEKMHPGEDSLFADQMVVRAKKVIKTDTILYRYLQREGSVMHVAKLAPVLSSITSMLLRSREVRGWEKYPLVRDVELKVQRGTLGGQIYDRMRHLKKEDFAQAWSEYIKVGREVFKGSSRLYDFVFQLGWRWLICVVFFWQYKFRVGAVKLVRAVR